MNQVGLKAVDEAIANGVDLDGTAIPSECLIYITKLCLKKIKEREVE